MDLLPGNLRAHLEEEAELSIRSATRLSGGDINSAAKISTNSEVLFLKWNRPDLADMFVKEARGLKLLREAGSGLRVPHVIACGGGEKSVPGYLLLEYIEPQRGDRNASAAFGRRLARLHACNEDHFGLSFDNYIGRLPQSNRMAESWSEFFPDSRIEPQLKMAIDQGRIDSSIQTHWDRLAGRLEEIFPECRPSLIHGDLWGGNYFFDADNRAVLIDPAVYYGHPEMELSFTRMFGGFSDAFYDAYAGETRIEPGFSDRIPIYNLYPLLVHVNLFGGHYSRQAESLLKQF